jgi:predicted DCC family thiol-disulfide oxidoreductase YuxK
MKTANWPLQVFFDGACPLCSREMAIVRRRDRHGNLQLIDIARPDFDAPALGLDPLRLQQAMHVRGADGTLYIGVDAFLQLWLALFLRGLLQVPGMPWFARRLYGVFARNRHRLTGRCTPETCALPPQ